MEMLGTTGTSYEGIMVYIPKYRPHHCCGSCYRCQQDEKVRQILHDPTKRKQAITRLEEEVGDYKPSWWKVFDTDHRAAKHFWLEILRDIDAGR